MAGRHRREQQPPRELAPGLRRAIQAAAVVAAVLMTTTALVQGQRTTAEPEPLLLQPTTEPRWTHWPPPRITTPRPTSHPPTTEEVVPAETTATSQPAEEPPPPPPEPEPEPEPPPPPPPEECPTELDGTLPHVAQAGHHIAQQFGHPLGDIGGYRPNARDPDGHPAGRALDFGPPITRDRGDAIAAYALEHRDELAVEYVIWRQRINHGSGWEPMEDRGSATANHYDHVHINFEASPGSGLPC